MLASVASKLISVLFSLQSFVDLSFRNVLKFLRDVVDPDDAFLGLHFQARRPSSAS